jgi:hypothetical protein
MAFGSDRFHAGLRIIKNNVSPWRMSDGTRFYPGGYEAVFLLGNFFCIAVIVFPYVYLLGRWGFLRKGDDDDVKSTRVEQ